MTIKYELRDIKKVAKDFISMLGDIRVIALHGEMGAGKTTFIHAICDVLGVKDVVGSPTFSIINEYAYDKNSFIYHIDLYRVKNETEAMQAGVEDCLYSDHLVFIEWPEKVPRLLPPNTLHLQLTEIGDRKRELKTR